MPKRKDLKKILIIGSGPIVIGQACEFDYSGTQGCRALREEGIKVVLVNNNPATIMTDPDTADSIYCEPITVEVVEKIIAKEKPDALLPTLGGQTALNISLQLAEGGSLERYGVEMIGARAEAIRLAEDRDLFKEAMQRIGLDLPKSGSASNLKEAKKIATTVGYPLLVRPFSTLGGSGAGIVYEPWELEKVAGWAIKSSPFHKTLIEESVLGWKEYELEVMRDQADNVVIICSIENLDPMGIHTGDSITVAPAQTLTDKEYQTMRDAAVAVMREIGVDTGGSNIQFAVNPEDGRLVVIEMNPRVSRSSALASKATGFPIAKIAAKLAIGYTLDELPNDITRETMASFEPTIDYVVVKIPRWAFEKFPEASPVLGAQMKSVGETMAIGRTFKEALQKGLRSLEIDRFGLRSNGRQLNLKELEDGLRRPNPERLFLVGEALRQGMDIQRCFELTKIDPFFLHNINQIIDLEREIISNGSLCPELMRKAKQYGFSDRELADLVGQDEDSIRQARKSNGLEATFKTVDTCAAEFEAYTPYYYSTYELESETKASDKPKIIVLGSGPNRIGQGIEFDYCCVHAAMSLKEEGIETIMINSNPETVSTDYDISTRLYFEPLTLEDVLNITDREKPDGLIVQFGGQTPLKLAMPLWHKNLPIIGTSPDSIDRAEDRGRFKEMVDKLGLLQPASGTARSLEEAKKVAAQIGYPILLRPSYVLGGRAMEIVYDENSLENYMEKALSASASLEHPLLIDKFLEEAIEVDVDAVSDGKRVVIGGIMEHIEEAGIHSGDSIVVLPPYTLVEEQLDLIRKQTKALAMELKVTGLINIQFAFRGDRLYVLEVNPRASRTIPFVSKSIGRPLAKIAAKVMTGNKSLKDLGFTHEVEIPYFAVKVPVFPFHKFKGVEGLLGPEMKSTGEVIGIDPEYGLAFAKGLIGAGQVLPKRGTVFISVKNKDKRAIIFIAKKLEDLGFNILATRGTAQVLARNGIKVKMVYKVYEMRPPEEKKDILTYIQTGKVDLIINTPSGKEPKQDDLSIRKVAILNRVPCLSTIQAAAAAVQAIESLIKKKDIQVRSLKEYYPDRT